MHAQSQHIQLIYHSFNKVLGYKRSAVLPIAMQHQTITTAPCYFPSRNSKPQMTHCLTEYPAETAVRSRRFGSVLCSCGSSSVGTAAHRCSVLLKTNKQTCQARNVCTFTHGLKQHNKTLTVKTRN